MPVSELY